MAVNQLDPVVPNEAQPQAQDESTSQGALPDVPLAKKYQGDWNKANEGYFNAVNKLQEAFGVVNQLQVENQQVKSVLAQMLGGQPAQADPWAAVGNELGLTDPAPLRSSVRQEVMLTLQEMFTPLAAQVTAEETLADEIENFDQLKVQARQFLKANPEVDRVFKAVKSQDPIAAWKYAIRETLVAKGGAVPARGGSGLSPTPGGSPNNRVTEDPKAQQLREQEALQYGNQYGDLRPYTHERYKGTSIERAIKSAMRSAGYDPDGAY